MRAFIVRPFGLKEGIDFERVERELIQPALNRLKDFGLDVSGATTGEITRQGNIREDMFRLLVIADIVIADVSIHNANVFYELGIRHALRPRHTFLIRSPSNQRYPFDLQIDRYFVYDATAPDKRVDEMAQALSSTLASGVSNRSDSPVFTLLPNLKAHGRGQLIKAPIDFEEDVERARHNGWRGDLRLFANEVGSFEWDQEALRLIGDAQFKIRAYAGARVTFESLQRTVANEVQANLRLGTIYQRLTLSTPSEQIEDLLARSDQAIRRVVEDSPPPATRAEAYALLGSNEKARWMTEYRRGTPTARAAAALGSAHLPRMLDWYMKAANLDLNAHYPAVNVLALLTIQRELAKLAPDIWTAAFEDDAKAAAALTARETLASRLVSSLRLALEMDDVMGRREGVPPDSWAEASRADLLLLTVADKPQRISAAYSKALTGADRFTIDATRRSLEIYQELGLLQANVGAALKVVDAATLATGPERTTPTRVILFTGHRVDAPGRAQDKQRFPRTPQAEAKARALIEEAVRRERTVEPEGEILALAGGACGGDILFHEVCKELGIATLLYLALPEAQFEVESVQDGGPEWVERYRKLLAPPGPRVLQQTKALPRWLADKQGYDIWQRNNLWLMFNALAMGARELTLIALYNQAREPDGPGGTKHLLNEAGKWGFKLVELDARVLLEDAH